MMTISIPFVLHLASIVIYNKIKIKGRKPSLIHQKIIDSNKKRFRNMMVGFFFAIVEISRYKRGADVFPDSSCID